MTYTSSSLQWLLSLPAQPPKKKAFPSAYIPSEDNGSKLQLLYVLLHQVMQGLSNAPPSSSAVSWAVVDSLPRQAHHAEWQCGADVGKWPPLMAHIRGCWSRSFWKYLDVRYQWPTDYTLHLHLEHISPRRLHICLGKSFNQSLEWNLRLLNT